MIRRGLGIAIAVLLILTCIAPVAFAEEQQGGAGVSFDISGYYRVRYDNIFRTKWLYHDDSNWWTYFDQRALLTPRLLISDRVSLNTQLDLLRNVNFGNNLERPVPLAVVRRNEANLEQIQSVNFEQRDVLQGNVLSQDMSNTDVLTNEEVDSIILRRLWGEARLPIGVVRVGRQGSNFGMGLFANDGDGYDDDYGDTYDRLLYGFRFGPWAPVFMYDKVVEDTYKVADTDVHQFGWINNFKDIRWGNNNQFDGGLYILNRSQQSTEARIWVYDAWARFMLGGFTLEAEAVALQGKMVVFDGEEIDDLEEDGIPVGQGGGKVIIDAYLAAGKFGYTANTWGVGAEGGFSSPDDPEADRNFSNEAALAVMEASSKASGDPDGAESKIDFITSVVENQQAFGDRMYSFAFDKDYNVDLIIWEVLMGGAVRNGIYAKVGGFLNPVDFFTMRLDVMKNWINEPGKGFDGTDASNDLGWEMDWDFALKAADHFEFGIQFGYAWPGTWFEDVYENTENVYTMQTRFLFHF